MSTPTPHRKTVRFALFDVDSGTTLGQPESLTIDVFTDSQAEVYCRLRDFLTYDQGMSFPETCDFECCRDDKFGKCYFAEADWHRKKFGILFV